MKKERKYKGPPDGADPIAVKAQVTLVPYDREIPAWAWCHYCKAAPATTRDHIVPKAKGGPSRWWNLVPSCQPCNLQKGSTSSWCNCPFCLRAKVTFDQIKRSKR